MELARKPYQGVLNIVRFNWHFYVVAIMLVLGFALVRSYLPEMIQEVGIWAALAGVMTILISLIVSFYVYDLSDLYELNWVPKGRGQLILNVNAGFDETSSIIKKKDDSFALTICDFYDPDKHTEVSIKRARKSYPPEANTVSVSTDALPFRDQYFDVSLAILSAHEIRDDRERIRFFKELNRITKPTGNIYVTEHLRDMNNFLAYTFGYFHFHSKSTWERTFMEAGLVICNETKTTRFITTFTIQSNGATL